MILIILVLISVSCSKEISLQKYYVESENNKEILMVDIPTSLLKIEDSLSVNAKEALASVKKLNLLAFRLKKDNEEAFVAERAKIKQILSNKSYKELIRLNDNGIKIKVKFLGDDESMNEVIVYATDNNRGFVLGRLLGDNMKPENMIHLLESVKDMNIDNSVFKSMESFFK